MSDTSPNFPTSVVRFYGSARMVRAVIGIVYVFKEMSSYLYVKLHIQLRIATGHSLSWRFSANPCARAGLLLNVVD
jgi:hypothetical protein